MPVAPNLFCEELTHLLEAHRTLRRSSLHQNLGLTLRTDDRLGDDFALRRRNNHWHCSGDESRRELRIGTD